MKSNHLIAFAGVSGAVAVALGAFAAHGLKAVLSPYLLGVFETGVHYQFLHTVMVLACAILIRFDIGKKAQKGLSSAAICFIIGILCFSGSLYALALTGIKWFGPITPLGGVFFIIGWVLLAVSAFKMNEVSQ